MSDTQSIQTNASSEVTRPSNRPEDWWKHPRSQATFKVSFAVILVGLVAWWFLFRPYVSTDDARVAATLVKVSNQGAGGPLVTITVTEGSPVTTGMVLAELDHTSAQAQLQKAQARATLTEQQWQRLTKLVASHAAPQQQLDNALQDYKVATADLALAQLAFDRTYLKSPLDGVVVQKTIEVGNMVETGQTAFTVADLAHAWVSANIEETSVGLVQLGQDVKISVDEGGRLTGKVSEIRRAVASQFSLIPADSGAGNFTKQVQRVAIKVALDAHPGVDLRAGQSVVIRIHTR